MNKKISNILDCVEYCPLPVREEETQSTERIVNLTMNKINAEKASEWSHAPQRTQRVRRSFATAAVAIILVATMTGVALAATGIIDFGAFYNSIFRSEEAAPYVASENGVSEVANSGELDISLIAALVTGRTAYIELEVSGENIPDDLFFFYHDEIDYETLPGELPADPLMVWNLTKTDPIVTRVDENTVRVALTLTEPYFTYYAFNKDESQPIRGMESLTGLLVFDTVSSASTPDDNSAVTFTGDWRFEFDIVALDYISYTTDVGEYEAWVGYSATEVTIAICSYDFFENGFEYPYDRDGALVLTLYDGRTITASLSSAEYVLTQIPSLLDLKYGMEFIDPRNVESVTFCGEILTDTGRAGDGGA